MELKNTNTYKQAFCRKSLSLIMNNAIEIQKDIWWIGVNDRRTHIFENYWPLPKGVAYNSYVIVDEKIVVVDTVERSRMDDYLESLESVIGNRQVDYLIINHMEPDHTGADQSIVVPLSEPDHYREQQNFSNAGEFLRRTFQPAGSERRRFAEHRKRTLNFYMVPMLHWPETMVTYLPGENIVFSGDIFGAFGTLDGGIFDDQVDLDYLEEEISRYYSNIVGKYGMPAQTALKKLNTLTFNTICATHGPIWRSHVCDIIAKYEKWSKYETEEGVVIAFSSMYGHTEQMADMIGRVLAEKGVSKIRIHDTSKTHPSYIINDIFRYKGVILGSCAYNGGIFPTMETLLCELENMGVKNHASLISATRHGVAGLSHA